MLVIGGRRPALRVEVIDGGVNCRDQDPDGLAVTSNN